MATTLANRLENQIQENLPAKHGAIIKKRTAIPTTRPALETIDNKKVLTSKAVGDAKQKMQLQKPTTTRNALKASNIPMKPRTTLQKSVQNKPTLKVNHNKAISQPKALPTSQPIKQEIQKLLPSSVKDSPMLIGSPCKIDTDDLSSNIFDLNLKSNVENIDENDCENPQLCSEFVNDIYHYMLYLESESPIRRNYFKDTGFKPRVRCILVDWLVQVHHRFQLLQETLYLTIAILDRFLQVHPVPKVKLQLAGVTAMLLASKYEEMYAPEVSDFVYITDKAFTQAQILSMEILMLKTINFSLGRPLPLHFLRRNSKAGQVDATQHTLAKYLMELSLVDNDMCHVPPSQLAAGALCLSIKLLKDSEWTPTLEHYSTYTKEDLIPVVCHLAKNLKSAEKSSYQQAVKSKFSSHKMMKIARIDAVKGTMVEELAEQAASHKL
ncbi:G2/mitotic-specific cyclin-B2-like [Ciona intestinalis]